MSTEPLCMSCVHPECEYAGRDVRLFICLHEYTRRPLTNRERLAAMDNKKFAMWITAQQLSQIEELEQKTGLSFEWPDYGLTVTAADWLEWLESPAGKEGKTDA